MARFAPEHLELWTKADNYGGRDWSDWYVVETRHRDSDRLSESNWDSAFAILDAAARRLGERRCTLTDDGHPVRCIEVARANHWAVGWCEALCVHKDSPPSILRAADDIRRRLADYPVLDESDYGQREFDYAAQQWADFDLRDRLFYIGRANESAGEEISIFAARRPSLPAADMGGLLQMLARE